jgi:hypothetical protein
MKNNINETCHHGSLKGIAADIKYEADNQKGKYHFQHSFMKIIFCSLLHKSDLHHDLCSCANVTQKKDMT